MYMHCYVHLPVLYALKNTPTQIALYPEAKDGSGLIFKKHAIYLENTPNRPRNSKKENKWIEE